MIVDDLAARSRWFHKLVRRAHIIRVPFPVYPQEWDPDENSLALNWKMERIPRGLIPRRGDPKTGNDFYDPEFLRAPLKEVIICSDQNEAGLLYVSFQDFNDAIEGAYEHLTAGGHPMDPTGAIMTRQQFDEAVAHWQRNNAATHVMAYLIGHGEIGSNQFVDPVPGMPQGPEWEKLTVQIMDYMTTDCSVAAGPLSTTLFAEDAASEKAGSIYTLGRSLRLTLEANDVPEAEIKAEINERYKYWASMGAHRHRRFLDGMKLDMRHCLETITATFGLMNCKNVTQEVHEPPPKVQRKRRKRGKLPLYRYHVLRVRPGMRSAVSRSGEPTGEHVAIHIVRGHFKRFTEDRPLFGKHVGLYWWQPHVAGQAKRVVEKEYQVVN